MTDRDGRWFAQLLYHGGDPVCLGGQAVIRNGRAWRSAHGQRFDDRPGNAAGLEAGDNLAKSELAAGEIGNQHDLRRVATCGQME